MALNTPFDRFSAARGDPNRRMRLLHGTWPDRTIAELEKFPFVAPHRFGPSGHDQIVGFFETPARLFRAHAVPDIFRRDAAHEAGDQTAIAETIDHGVLFRDADRMIA